MAGEVELDLVAGFAAGTLHGFEELFAVALGPEDHSVGFDVDDADLVGRVDDGDDDDRAGHDVDDFAVGHDLVLDTDLFRASRPDGELLHPGPVGAVGGMGGGGGGVAGPKIAGRRAAAAAASSG